MVILHKAGDYQVEFDCSQGVGYSSRRVGCRNQDDGCRSQEIANTPHAGRSEDADVRPFEYWSKNPVLTLRKQKAVPFTETAFNILLLC